ncbi:hypothetical protein HDU67_008837, partial [Dinochytrium kinnereticum]
GRSAIISGVVTTVSRPAFATTQTLTETRQSFPPSGSSSYSSSSSNGREIFPIVGGFIACVAIFACIGFVYKSQAVDDVNTTRRNNNHRVLSQVTVHSPPPPEYQPPVYSAHLEIPVTTLSEATQMNTTVIAEMAKPGDAQYV